LSIYSLVMALRLM